MLVEIQKSVTVPKFMSSSAKRWFNQKATYRPSGDQEKENILDSSPPRLSELVV
jgi:hypothetical protein